MEEEGNSERDQKPKYVEQEDDENGDADPVGDFPFLASLEMINACTLLR